MPKQKSIAQYEIVEEIGRGGFAVVYRARDTELDLIVALKVLHPYWAADPGFTARFRQEARAAAGLRHPHVVTVHEVGEEAGQHYLAMAFLPGRTLDKRLAEGPLPVEQAVSIVEQVAGALDEIHGRGLVHRDVKPGNIMLDDAGQATLLDFGIVRAAEGTRLTTTMAVLGTPEYMAPEQAELEEVAGIDWRADIYALGVVAYEMLVGRPPFTGKSPTAILHKHIYEPPPTPIALNPDLPAGLEPALLEALAKGREERFQRAGTFAARLRRALLSESQIREREAQLAPLYEQLQAAAAEEDWAEVLALGGQMRVLDPDYRDVPELMEWARTQMRRPRRKPMPAWAWIVGGVALLALLIGLGGWALGWWPAGEPTATPVHTATSPPPTATPAPPTGTPAPTPAPIRAPVLGDTWIRPADGMVMVYVPGGTFQMGSDASDPDADDDEFPQHFVTLNGFWIDQTEVTNGQFARFVEERGYETDAGREGWGWVILEGSTAWEQIEGADWQHPEGPESDVSDRMDHPVVLVSWNDAAAYCEWAGGRLPTEAEWEYAARGEQGYIYPWGDEFDCSRGNFDDETEITDDVGPGGEGCDGYVRTAPVGSFPGGVSWCGALDLAGNIWEWVADWYGDYSSGAQTNPTGPVTGDSRVLCGGAFDNVEASVRAANRYGSDPGSRYGTFGFRCVGGAPGQ